MRSRIFFKLLAAYLLVVVAATGILDLSIRRHWETSFRAQLQRSLEEKARMLADRAEHKSASENFPSLATAAARASAARATIIDAAGTVLADSAADPQQMENHAERPEFIAALHGQLGVSQRWSHTRGVDFLYVAVPFAGGAVRLAYPLTAIDQGKAAIRSDILSASALVLLVAVTLAALFAAAISRRLQRMVRFAGRLASGDFSARVAESTDDEIGQLAAALDLTAQRLQHNVEDIRRVESTRRDFVANVSHELKTPLTSIVGYTETLLESETDPVRREFLETLKRNGERMARLTDDLLTLARIESGNQPLSLAAVPATRLLEDAEAGFRRVASARRIELRIAEIAPCAVLADIDAIHQVFANLIDNALKYAPGARIELGAREVELGVEFYVRDFGPGIPDEHLPRLFERFYRVDKARSRESGGTGLGLAIVKHLVAAHGGTVRVSSTVGSGTTMVFQLPLATAPARAPAAIHPKSTAL